MRLNQVVISFLLLGSMVASATSQPLWLEVESNDPGALVYADSTWLGFVAQSPFGIPSGTVRIRVVSSAVDSWSRPPIEMAVDSTPADTLRLQAGFDYRYRFESVPSATVFDTSNRTELGRTPLELSLEKPLYAPLTVYQPGFESAEILPDSSLWSRQFILLEPSSTEARTAPPDVSLHGPGRSDRWVDWVAAGLAVSGGLVAVHYKLQADRRYDRYQETGDPTLRPEIKRLDTRSGAGLGAMQVGLGVIALRFVLR